MGAVASPGSPLGSPQFLGLHERAEAGPARGLTYLDVSHNSVGDKGVRALALALKGSSVLR